MRIIDPEEIMTMYFVIIHDKDGKRIQAWSENKDMAESYIEFYKSDMLSLKKVTKSGACIEDIIRENINDEIGLKLITVRDGDKTKDIYIPATKTDALLINDETSSMLSSRIDYGFLNGALYFLKDKYQDALQDIFLEAAIHQVVHNDRQKIFEKIKLDQMAILFYSRMDMFGT